MGGQQVQVAIGGNGTRVELEGDASLLEVSMSSDDVIDLEHDFGHGPILYGCIHFVECQLNATSIEEGEWPSSKDNPQAHVLRPESNRLLHVRHPEDDAGYLHAMRLLQVVASEGGELFLGVLRAGIRALEH